ncbi:hypothetical protein [Actinomadura rupiterrae]|uniref:hypothetical protein n=1 Tax=Actinomadura rupiterrae TaxID=559627 RepID=UPI0020A26C16|nr:hypothetical protein [Actinomadura rupiterrae]MCP2341528.1 hypothetical protein [Actinomadura rupiterrae]
MDASPNAGPRYPYLREALRSEYAGLPDSALESLLPQLTGTSAEDAENWLSTLGNAAGQVGRFLAQNPGVVQAAGTLVGGPVGGLVAGALPGLLGTLTGTPAAPPPAAVAAAPPVAGAGTVVPVAAAIAAPTPGPAPSGDAAARLLAVLARPETIRAIGQMVLGGAGRGNVTVGGTTPVPAAAFSNLLGALATQASAEFAAAQALPAAEFYLSADPGADPGNPEDRARALLQLLRVTDPPSDPLFGPGPAGPAGLPERPEGPEPVEPGEPSTPTEPTEPTEPAAPASWGERPRSPVRRGPVRSRRTRGRARRYRRRDWEAAEDIAASELETAAWYELARVVGS